MKKKSVSLEVVNPNACGIDVGSRSHFVSIGQGEKTFGNLEYIMKICEVL